MSRLKYKGLSSRQGRTPAPFNFINLARSEAKDFSGMTVILYLLLSDPTESTAFSLKLGQKLKYTFVQVYSRL